MKVTKSVVWCSSWLVHRVPVSIASSLDTITGATKIELKASCAVISVVAYEETADHTTHSRVQQGQGSAVHLPRLRVRRSKSLLWHVTFRGTRSLAAPSLGYCQIARLVCAHAIDCRNGGFLVQLPTAAPLRQTFARHRCAYILLKFSRFQPDQHWVQFVRSGHTLSTCVMLLPAIKSAAFSWPLGCDSSDRPKGGIRSKISLRAVLTSCFFEYSAYTHMHPVRLTCAVEELDMPQEQLS